MKKWEQKETRGQREDGGVDGRVEGWADGEGRKRGMNNLLG